MNQPKGAVFARVTFTFRTKRFADAYAKKCEDADLTMSQDREASHRGWHVVHVWVYRGEALP